MYVGNFLALVQIKSPIVSIKCTDNLLRIFWKFINFSVVMLFVRFSQNGFHIIFRQSYGKFLSTIFRKFSDKFMIAMQQSSHSPIVCSR